MNDDGDPPVRTTLPLSVVIPAYNRAGMIARAVRSALGQRPRPPAEVIVVDDGSTDETGRVAADAGARVITHEVNRGEGAARNTGIAAASEPWIALLDSDDEWMGDLLGLLWPRRGAHAVVGGGSLNCGADPRRDRYNGPTGRQALILRSPAPLVYPENFIAASGTLVRRDAVRAAGGWPEGVRGGADMDLWIRVLERGTAIILPRPVVVYHLHEGQVTTDPQLMVDAHRAIALRYSDRPWWRPRHLTLWEGARAYDATRRALRDRDPVLAGRALLGLLSSPTRMAGALGILVRRSRLARRSGLYGRDGRPTEARLASAVALRRALWRPPAHAVVAPAVWSWAWAVALRAAGAQTVRRG